MVQPNKSPKFRARLRHGWPLGHEQFGPPKGKLRHPQALGQMQFSLYSGPFLLKSGPPIVVIAEHFPDAQSFPGTP